MVNTSISSNTLVNQLNVSYQRLAEAQARVQESKAEVEKDRNQLDNSKDRNNQDRKDYAQALRKNQTLQTSDTQYAVQQGSGTQQVHTEKTSAITVPVPTVNSSGQTVGSTIHVTA